MGAFTAGALTLPAAPTWPGLLAGTALIGLATAPLGAVASTELQRAVPADRWAEGFSLVFVVQEPGSWPARRRSVCCRRP
ncbi:hypothetical protein AB0I60_18955 [Actinosynnema sp. NPDC050436]|uniref:hypothetical protein n=1 Tax=Actinosynnema sp. NPDC050436 TaxID=3155659 RepID=UPI0033F54DC9